MHCKSQRISHGDVRTSDQKVYTLAPIVYTPVATLIGKEHGALSQIGAAASGQSEESLEIGIPISSIPLQALELLETKKHNDVPPISRLTWIKATVTKSG